MKTKSIIRNVATGAFALTLALVPTLLRAQFIVNNDTTLTGPLQPVVAYVTLNDIIPSTTYTVSIGAITPAGAGTAVLSGTHNIKFTPSAGIPATGLPFQYVDIAYTVDVGGNQRSGILTVIVEEFNLPANVLMSDVDCYAPMQTNITFTPSLKYTLGVGSSDNNHLNTFSMAVVGDLNGDGKPEIIVMGGHSSNFYNPHINIFNGQTGRRMMRYDIRNGYSYKNDATSNDENSANGYTSTLLPNLPGASHNYNTVGGEDYHNGLQNIAIADIDNDGYGEIIFSADWYNAANPGGLYCLRPNWLLSPNNTSGIPDSIDTANPLTLVWRSTDATGTNYYHLQSDRGTPNNSHFEKAMPYIADFNGDGKAEILVLNKIFDGQTGRLVVCLETLDFFVYSSTQSTADVNRQSAFVGRLTTTARYKGMGNMAVIGIEDFNGDGILDIAAGSKVYIMKDVGGTLALDHIIYGPPSLTAQRGTTSATFTTPATDGFTAIADMDGDGKYEVIVTTNLQDGSGADVPFVVYMWDPMDPAHAGTLADPQEAKAVTYLRPNGTYGTYGLPFVGDINGYNDDYTGTKKLPELCFVMGGMRIEESYVSKIKPHPLATTAGNGALSAGEAFAVNGSGELTNRTATPVTRFSGWSGAGSHIVAWTYHANPDGSTPLHQRMKLAWAMEVTDNSNMTGITMFDFDNNGTQDLCYRGISHIEVISPTKNNQRYLRDDDTSSSQFMMKYSVNSDPGTGYEAPVIADVNMDASADIIVSYTAGYAGSYGVFEHAPGSDKWAPCPPVWNQARYNPRFINEDLTVPAKPISRLTEFTNYNGVLIKPYNSEWTQQPIVKYGDQYVPVIRVPDLQVLDVSLVGSTLSFKVMNTGQATNGSNIHIRIYRDSYTTLFQDNTSLRELFPGDVQQFNINVGTFITSIFYIVVGSTLDSQYNIQVPLSASDAALLSDCNWANNIESVAAFLLRDDYATVPYYSTVMIDILNNDILNTCSNLVLDTTMFRPAGSVSPSVSGAWGKIEIVNNKIIYHAPASTYVPDTVIDLTYSINCGILRTAHIYIYLVGSCTGTFSACAGTSYTVCLKDQPTGIRFQWYDNQYQYLGTTAPTIPVPVNNVSYYVKPDFSVFPNSKFRLMDFPLTQITVNVNGGVAPNVTDTMRWTGFADEDWHNPSNWVKLKNGKQMATEEMPNSSCVDVILGANCPNYPTITSPVTVRNIHLEDRAMLVGLQHLTYTAASIEFIPVPSEKGRFVMWSAPLKDVYTGDYHFQTSGLPHWGNIYMNFFQSLNPDVGSMTIVREKTFTATFGTMNFALSLGRPFNIYMLPDTEGEKLYFPQTATSYTDANGNTVSGLSRTNAGRFITDGVLAYNGDIAVQYGDYGPSWALVQVLNPFPAYLKVNEFLTLPSNVPKLQSSYKVWSGNIDEDFTSVLLTGDTMRMVLTDNPVLPTGTETLIPPYQSFFVTKQSSYLGMAIGNLNYNSSMTTTKNGTSSARYVLRSLETMADDGLLRITARQSTYKNATVLRHEASATASYDENADSRKAFLDGVPVLVYSLTADGKTALAINQSNDFSAPVRLCIRVRNTETPVTLEFSDIKTFGRKVYLYDYEADKTIDLQQSPTYLFVVKQQLNSDGVAEITDRFELRFGEPTTATAISDGVDVYSVKGGIYVGASSGTLTKVVIYNLLGQVVTRRDVKAPSVVVPLASGEVYLVAPEVDGKAFEVRKVLVQ
ncbi:MAG: VCBS repeat-containing protein [Tannerella sp.]|jgi:hypothetical protein|nr:VCBS repeat-containing protein [Tannerella sp.]